MADGGYTPREIDKFTLADVNLLYSEWSRIPPVRAMVAAYLKIEVRGRKKAAPATPAVTSIAALKAMFPAGVMKG
jgi:hypothetical protein